MSKFDHDAFVQEINSRHWNGPFNLARQEANKITPYEFIRDTILSTDTSQLTVPQKQQAQARPEIIDEFQEEMPQEVLIDRVESLGSQYHDKLWDKFQELVETIRPQYQNNVMSQKAREFAMRCLGTLENIDRFEKRKMNGSNEKHV